MISAGGCSDLRTLATVHPVLQYQAEDEFECGRLTCEQHKLNSRREGELAREVTTPLISDCV